MTVSEAINKAKGLRPTVMTDRELIYHLGKLEYDLAEALGITGYCFSEDENAELLADEAHDEIYVFYLATRIDIYNQETALYNNDNTALTAIYNDYKAWIIRHKDYKGGSPIKVM